MALAGKLHGFPLGDTEMRIFGRSRWRILAMWSGSGGEEMIESTLGSPDNLLDAQVSCRHLIDISPDAVLIHHHDRIVLVNDECLHLFGVTTREDILGQSPLHFVPLDTRSDFEAQFKKVCSDHTRTKLTETAICRRNGERVEVEMIAIPVPRLDGSLAILVALRDVSERRRLRQERERSENHVRMILDTAMDGIISMDEQQNIILFNSAAEAIFGWRADQVIGRSINLLIPSRYVPQHRQSVEQFGRGQIPSRRMSVQRTVMALRASGEEFPIEASISHTKVDDQRVFTVILRDVTEAVQYRQQIEQQSQMLDHVSDAVSVVDPMGRISYWNHAAQTLFGWSAEEAIGRTASSLLNRMEAPVFANGLPSANERYSFSGELTMTNRAGRSITVDHRSTVLKDENDVVQGYLFIDIDITNRKKKEQTSNRSQRLESIGTLASGIAHDLNNVLTPILMGAKLLSSDRAPANRQGLLNTMVASAQRGAGLIQQLLSFAGGIRGEQSPVQIEKLVDETRSLLEHTLPKSIHIQTIVGDDCAHVIGDSTELAQILMNLSVNARDAMPDGGTLTIEAETVLINGNALQYHPDARPGTYLLISVSDTGCGMNPEVLNRIFDPFFTTKEIGKGTGLGLATVQGIVKSHGGFVMVYSEVDRGSKFSIYLPAGNVTESSAIPAEPTVLESGNGRLILLVDDEEMILRMTSASLESAGYRILTAADGTAAISVFSQHRHEIAAVLMDMMMPGVSGLETLDQMLRIAPETKVIACSGLRTNQRETEVLARGAVAFLPKPYTDQQLLQLLSQILTPRAR